MKKILNKTTNSYIEDISGEKFGRLKVLRFDQERFDSEYIKGRSTNIYFLCQCECGNIVSVYKTSLKNGDTVSCGCFKRENTSKLRGKNKVGMKFNKLTAVERIKNYNNTGNVYYKCECECGNCTYIDSRKFSENGTKSCGCAIYEFAESRVKYSVGDKVGRLSIVKMIREKKEIIYICECDCGNKDVKISIDSFNNNNPTQSCGCLHSEVTRGRYDNKGIIGKKFNMLTVIGEDLEKEKQFSEKKRKVRFWFCECDCGCITSISTTVINKGKQISCGCCKSRGEFDVKRWLKTNNIEYEYEKRFDGLVGLNKGNLSYDFYIPEFNLLIEVNGEQHEKAIPLFGGEKQLKIQKAHDKMKRNYAKSNRIEMLEIWYYDYDYIEDILYNYFESCIKLS